MDGPQKVNVIAVEMLPDGKHRFTTRHFEGWENISSIELGGKVFRVITSSQFLDLVCSEVEGS